ncbi:MAG: hypothetical protein A2751_01320 [Candidatus Doudnabacteria bacterium RIFCSPHIGHO2_01_FULL_46_14]|uniref:ATP-cone domain-containing protein n=1 Tax=Candidatus Doudnabacteria bacterium RIFCSPHIGHO2_01_FULL_46_14 TaxID=1817824 RepID=A0A1F5NMG6_9BACT|nr:MAG: hypothetical protein A2751_01320 [Candidatus Doudnabacteria bacterium RIFCSPHIGHO2_01_FULL_46_14]
MPHIVKRRGHKEPFDGKKVYAASYAACRNAHLSEMLAENIADTVQKRLESWVDAKNEISSDEIFREIITVLKELHPDAAFLFETHRDIS